MHQRDEARDVTEPEACHQTRLEREFLPRRRVSRSQTKCSALAISSSTQSRLRLGGMTPSRRIWHSPIIWNAAAPPFE